VETARRVYAGPADIYPGVPRGSELDWGHFGPAPGSKSSPPFAPIFQWVFGANWDWHTFDLSDGPKRMAKLLAQDVNATDGNLTRFRSRGGKLIAYHGLADWLVVPGETLRYRGALLRDTKGNLDDYYRLYMIPGMAHCGGGAGLNGVDALGALVKWVEQDAAPGTLPASGRLRRPVCAYPQIAKYRGSGDPNDLASFTCVTALTP
jgi:feruloyl esterase